MRFEFFTYRKFRFSAFLALLTLIIPGCARKASVQDAEAKYNAPPQQYSTVNAPDAPITAPPTQVTPPAWAPAYDNVQGVQYYYLPDIGVYYNVWTGQYVVPYNGAWGYYTALPPAYSYYNPYSGFVVVLNQGVRQPWYNHSYYAAQYPTTYAQTVTGNYSGSRGYNENAKAVIYSPSNVNHTIPANTNVQNIHPAVNGNAVPVNANVNHSNTIPKQETAVTPVTPNTPVKAANSSKKANTSPKIKQIKAKQAPSRSATSAPRSGGGGKGR